MTRIKVVLEIVLILVVLLNVYTLLVPDGIPYAILEVTGSSMSPSLQAGDGVFVYESPYDTLGVSDVIVFMTSGELVTHEVIEVQETSVITKGSANTIEDDPVTEEMYVGKVLFSIPYIGILLFWFEGPWRIVGFSVILFLLFYGKELFTVIYDKYM